MPGDFANTKITLYDLSDIRGMVLDVDGILHEGLRALPGAVELIAWLNRHGFPYILFSNNTTRPFHKHVTRLVDLGMLVKPEFILTTARVTAHILAAGQSGALCFGIWEAGLFKALEAAANVRARIIGKPELPGFQKALQILQHPAHSVLMVGDQIEADIASAKRSGMQAFLVFSPVTPAYIPSETQVRVDKVFSSTHDFYQFWVGQKQ